MSLTFPRDLPARRFVQGSKIGLHRQVTMAPTRGGLVQVAEIAAPLWRARYETAALSETDGAIWEAWIDSLRAGARTFKAQHPFRRFAGAYPAGYAGMNAHGGGAFSGSGVLQAVGGTLDTVTLSGLPSSFVLSPGDMLSFIPSGSKQAFHRVVAGATASAGVATVSVEPVLRPGYTLSAAVLLSGPWFKGVLDQSTIRVTWSTARTCVVAFEAWQVLS